MGFAVCVCPKCKQPAMKGTDCCGHEREQQEVERLQRRVKHLEAQLATRQGKSVVPVLLGGRG